MMKRFVSLALLLLAGAAAQASAQTPAGKAQTPPPPPAAAAENRPLDLGHLEGGVYVNDFFGLSLSVPEHWVIVSAQRRSEIVEEAKKVVVARDQAQQAQIQDSIKRSAILLSLTKLPQGQPGNAAFMVVAERLPAPSVRSGADVFRLMEAGFKGSSMNVEFVEGVRSEQVGGADFAVATIRNNSPYGVYMQKIFITTRNGYALQLFYTYLDEADLPVFDAIIKSLRSRGR